MKLFSNFDTDLCEVQYAAMCKQYGKEKTLFIRRDRLYLLLKVYQPMVRWFLLSSMMMTIVYLYAGGTTQVIGWVCVVLSGLVIGYFAIQKRIDRWMDYTIITPRQVIQYDQTGLLNRSTRTLDLAKIKSINIQKNGLMTSVFDLGNIVFFSEGDESHGDIRLNYIKNPISLKQQITTIMHESLTAQQSAAQESGGL